jgi:hypothetical protein
MHPKLIGNPLVAWRDDRTLQVGWGSHGLVVEEASAHLPAWLRLLSGSRSLPRVLDRGVAMGMAREDLEELLGALTDVGLLECGAAPATVAVWGEGLAAHRLSEVLRSAGVQVQDRADAVVLPLGQLPTFFPEPPKARRLIPVWFEATAAHVGPVLDDDRGPCPRCIDREWAARDGKWPFLVSQASTVATWHDGVQVLQAAAGIALVASAPQTVGLEMIFDRGHPGPVWRVWKARDDCGCACEAPADMAMAGPGTPGPAMSNG